MRCLLDSYFNLVPLIPLILFVELSIVLLLLLYFPPPVHPIIINRDEPRKLLLLWLLQRVNYWGFLIGVRVEFIIVSIVSGSVPDVMLVAGGRVSIKTIQVVLLLLVDLVRYVPLLLPHLLDLQLLLRSLPSLLLLYLVNLCALIPPIRVLFIIVVINIATDILINIAINIGVFIFIFR